MRTCLRLLVASASLLLAVSCSSGGGDDVASGGIGGTGVTSGTISGFGSIFVNGRELEIAGAAIELDGIPATEGDLRLGMVVTATVELDGGGTITSTTHVIADNELEGPIADAPALTPDGDQKTFTVLGTTVIAIDSETVFDKESTVLGEFGFGALSKDDIIEVHGFFDEGERLRASYIRKIGTGAPLTVEVKGKVKNLAGPSPVCTAIFELRNLAVCVDGTTDLSGLPGGLAEGLFVEVRGVLTASGVQATTITLEGLPEDNAASVEGIIDDDGFVDAFHFVVNADPGPITVDASMAVFDPATLVPAPGLLVEVEGTLVDGTLVATKVKLRSALIKLETVVSAVSVPDPAGSPNVGTLTLVFPPTEFAGSQMLEVLVDNGTRMQDQENPSSPFHLVQIASSDFVRVKARVGDSGELEAVQVKRTGPRDVVLQGPADVPPTSGSTGRVSILGVSFKTDEDTEFNGIDDAPLPGGGGEFFASVTDGALIKVKDKDPADGVADEVEFED